MEHITELLPDDTDFDDVYDEEVWDERLLTDSEIDALISGQRI